MKSGSFLCGLGALAFVCQSIAAEPSHQFYFADTAPRFMLYFQHGFGASRHADAGLRLGFSVDRQLPPTLEHTSVPGHHAPLFDLRLSTTRAGTVWLNGFKLSGDPSYARRYEDSFDSIDWSSGWVWGGLGFAALAGLSCATRNLICEEDDKKPTPNSEYRVPGT